MFGARDAVDNSVIYKCKSVENYISAVVKTFRFGLTLFTVTSDELSSLKGLCVKAEMLWTKINCGIL